MDELFRQLAFINALLGGFAIAFLSTLLTAASTHRAVNWMVAVITTAATCFILGALGATFATVVLSAGVDALAPDEIRTLHQALSLLFLAGTLLLFVSFGMGGWLRSRKLGVVTSVIAAVAIVGGYLILDPFIY